MKTNNKILGITIGLFIFMMMIAIGCDSDTSTNTNIESTTIAEETKIVTSVTNSIKPSPKVSVKPSESTTVEPSHTPEKTTKKAVKKIKTEDVTKTKEYKLLQVNIIKNNFAGIAKVVYNEKNNTVRVTPIDSNFMIEMALAQNGNKTHIDNWNMLVDNFVSMSKNLDGTVISIVNNMNTENDILIVMDGMIVYDVLN